MAKTKKPLSGSAKLSKRGMKPVQLWLTPDQHETLFAAAAIDGRAAAHFMVYHGLAAARNILNNPPK